jgi:RNA polymerase sigma-70 factor (ECF subfamily)
MDESHWLADRFEENRGHLRAVAYRMLGSLSEADDAVQEAWLRLSRSGADDVENLGGWLTTVVARVCLDQLRARTSRREASLDEHAPEPPAKRGHATDPEYEAMLADSVGLAMLVVLDRLAPAERLAFVLHDMFDLSFEEIASIVGRTPTAARQLASRARRRVRGNAPVAPPDLPEQRKVVEAFLAALRAGDFEAIVAVLDPDFAIRSDQVAVGAGAVRETQGARAWAQQAIKFAQGARAARPALINGAVGLVVAPQGRLLRVISFTMALGKIVGIDVISDPARLAKLDLSVLGD